MPLPLFPRYIRPHYSISVIVRPIVACSRTLGRCAVFEIADHNLVCRLALSQMARYLTNVNFSRAYGYVEMGYAIEPTDYGYYLTFYGTVDAEEMKRWLRESQQMFSECSTSFGVLVNMQDMEPLEETARAVLIRGQHLYKRKGMVRSAVIVDVSPGQAQLERIANQSGIYPSERYVNAHEVDDPERIALAWICSGKEPDAQSAS